MRTAKAIILFGIVFSIQLLLNEMALASKAKKPNACQTLFEVTDTNKELIRLMAAGFSESVAARVLNYYPKHLFHGFFKQPDLSMSLVYRSIGRGGEYDPIYKMSYFNVIGDPFDAIIESQKWIQVEPFDINGVRYTSLVLELELPSTIFPGKDYDWKISPWKIPNDAIFIRRIGLENARTKKLLWIPFDQLSKYGFNFDLKEIRLQE